MGYACRCVMAAYITDAPSQHRDWSCSMGTGLEQGNSLLHQAITPAPASFNHKIIPPAGAGEAVDSAPGWEADAARLQAGDISGPPATGPASDSPLLRL